MSGLTADQVSQFLEALDEFYSQDNETKLNELFALFDRNGNGKIDSRELKGVMTSVTSHRMTDAEVQNMIDEADTNQDGLIDINEFIVVMRAHKASNQSI